MWNKANVSTHVYNVGDKVELLVQRNDNKVEVEVMLEESA